MEAQVLPDRVMIGTEFIPRRLDLVKKLVVPAGQTITLADGAVLDYVEVAGTLTVSRLHNTTAKITTLIVLPTGLMDFGTVTNPIPSSVQVRISIRNVSIDTTIDPFQWGNGIVSFGDWTTFGAFRTPEVIISDALAGATAVTLTSVPVGWQVGDELILPDTQTPLSSGPRRESAVTIAAISGMNVSLSKPLDFDHKTITGVDGRLGVHPVALNITRNIIITSDDPVGTPGHVANIGDDSCWDIQGTAFIGLGRTKILPLDSTSSDLTHIGTNQIGKYSFHEHHVHMPCTFPRQFVGNVLRGGGSGKWGHVTHGTSDTLVQDNIAIDFVGAGFITEDGYEVRNRFVHNIAAYNLNPSNQVTSRQNLLDNKPGIEGTGFWFHGIMQTIDRNEAWNNSIGFNLFDFQGKPGLFPSMVDGIPDTPFQTPYVNDGPFLLFDHTLVVGNASIGLDTWGLKDIGMTGTVANLPILDNVIAVNNFIGIAAQQTDAFNSGHYRNPTVIGSYSTGNGQPVSWADTYYGNKGVSITTGYVVPFKISNGYISGCLSGIYGVPNDNYIVDTTTIQCAVGVQFDVTLASAEAFGTHFYFTNVIFLPYGQHPPRYVVEKDGVLLWDGTGEFPLGGTPPTPPPPPPPVVWVTLAITDVGQVFQQQQGSTTQFRFCKDSTLATCEMVPAP